MSMNIAGLTAVDDFSYRYKMPPLQAKIEGRGNGIKTVLVNIVDLSTALHRDPAEITKFFGTELGSQTTYDRDIDRAIGKFSPYIYTHSSIFYVLIHSLPFIVGIYDLLNMFCLHLFNETFLPSFLPSFLHFFHLQLK